MSIIVPRTCTEIGEENGEQRQNAASQPLEAFRDVPAYVLLGDPGAGKTTAFKTECKELREKACLITARDFLTFNPQSHPEWRDKTLFIDGLDEIRVGANDARTPFDQIRGRLDELGKPRFRLSCREADWLGANDQKHLESVSPDSKVTVLRLNPLTDSDIAVIIDARSDIGDAQEFITLAREQGVEGLLTNPQTLKMLADVVGDDWPKSRKETFERACGQMVREHNEGRKAAQASNSLPAPDQLLDAAGQLCAVQVISGAAGYTLHGQADDDYPALDQYDYDRRETLRPALDTKLFKGVSDNDHRFSPVHRHIAEFLGARHLAGIIKSGLPARRVIALIAGEDGTVVTEMRGLSAWLAAHYKDARADLIECDPIGVGLYGDIREFSTDEKRALLKALRREGSRLGPVFLKTMAFNTLATPDMESTLKESLTDRDRSQSHQIFTRFVLRVLRGSVPLSGLSEILLKIVRDDTWCPDINTSALNVFIQNYSDSQDKTNGLRALLADIHTGSISDPDNDLLGILLSHLYPQELPPSEVWDYLIDRKLSRKSMNDAQRVHWLAAGIIILPETYNDLLRGFVQSHERQVPHLAEFFPLQDRVQFSFDELGIPGLELLIRLVGRYVGPGYRWGDESENVGLKMKASELVHLFIQNLAASPTKDASKALATLLTNPALSRWRDVLSRVQDAQRVIWRDASYRHPTIEQVCRTLNGGTPANAADLATLVMDRLSELADQIRRGNTDDWRQYWNEPHKKPPTPKHEDRCRDALLSDLRQRLPQGLDAQPEGQYANDKRSDIRVYFGGSNVPVEIKKNMHRDLWSAPRNQLITQYTIDPNTDSYGIYLVFWFGKDRTQPSPSGTRPANAEELKERLEATLSPNKARKISVCVIDVSRPD